MFTGIIEEIGAVRRIERGAKGARLTIAAKTVLEGTRIGDSIATNGVCLTVTDLTADSFSADVMAESLRRSGLGALQAGSPVNLERAMPLDGRFGGHIVSGHIDGTGTLASLRREDVQRRFRSSELLKNQRFEWVAFKRPEMRTRRAVVTCGNATSEDALSDGFENHPLKTSIFQRTLGQNPPQWAAGR